jgi:hypothetical protein
MVGSGYVLEAVLSVVLCVLCVLCAVGCVLLLPQVCVFTAPLFSAFCALAAYGLVKECRDTGGGGTVFVVGPLWGGGGGGGGVGGEGVTCSQGQFSGLAVLEFVSLCLAAVALVPHQHWML